MKLAVMQPYFFPYIGYFQLINAVDRFILLDDVQYIRRGWIHRNRILKPGEGLQYINISIADHSRDTLIKDIRNGDNEWKQLMFRQLEHYKKRAPFYGQVCNLLADCFSYAECSIAKVNGHYLKVLCDYIGIPFNIEISSQMNFDYSRIEESGDWTLRISEQLGASWYINPSGGLEIYNREKFAESNIKLSFLQAGLKEYDQFRPVFEPALSIVDVMMFNSPTEIKEMLNGYQLL